MLFNYLIYGSLNIKDYSVFKALILKNKNVFCDHFFGCVDRLYGGYDHKTGVFDHCLGALITLFCLKDYKILAQCQNFVIYSDC